MWAFIVVGLCLSWGVAPQMIRMSKEEIDRAKSNVHLGKSVFERPSPGGLILTPYVESGKIKKAQNFSRVRGGPFHDNIESYSGYFTVEKEYNSNLFFWFFPAENDYENAPVILWLQGGPGGSSMFGLFTELGPYRVEKDDATVTKAPYSWTENYSILYIDNPVETGFSFTENENGYSRNQSHVGANLYSALIQFFTLFPELQKNEFYVAGESYGGKYIPTIGYTIYKRNPSASLKINLKGLFIGNGLSDPVNMLHYSDFVYQIGLLDTDARDEVKYVEEYARKLITRGDYEKAAYAWFAALQHVCKMSGFNNLYNFLYHEEPKVGGNFSKFLNREDVKEALHVGENKEFYKSNRDVYMMMLSDLMASVRPWVEELLDNGIRVVYYSGQLDIIVAYAISVPYYNALKFNSADEYKTAVRLAWHVDGELAGYFKSAGNFTEVLVRNAGHMVPSDQPKWALDLLERFISNTL